MTTNLCKIKKSLFNYSNGGSILIRFHGLPIAHALNWNQLIFGREYALV